jgi:hypothetical protein
MSFFLFHYPALCFGFMYLEEVNSSYRQICKDINTDIHSKDTLLEKIKLEFKELQQQTSPGMQFSALIFYFSYCSFYFCALSCIHVFQAKEIDSVLSCKLVASSQLDRLLLHNVILRFVLLLSIL